jgi:hypothetical protein
MSAFLPVISTRFPAVNHSLHVKDKWKIQTVQEFFPPRGTRQIFFPVKVKRKIFFPNVFRGRIFLWPLIITAFI